MKFPPLQPLHHTTLLNRAKLNLYARLTTAELLQSLLPGQPGSLKVRNDGTILDGHHRIETFATTWHRRGPNAARSAIEE